MDSKEEDLQSLQLSNKHIMYQKVMKITPLELVNWKIITWEAHIMTSVCLKLSKEIYLFRRMSTL